jgi:hypothetical protein
MNDDVRLPGGKRKGRPAAGSAENGSSEPVSRYPKLTVYLPPPSKARLDALCVLESKPAWRILEAAFYAYFDHLPESEQAAVEGLVHQKELRRVAAATA